MSQPSVREEVINLRCLGGWQFRHHVLQVLKGIDAEALTSFDEAHDGGSGVSAFFRACEKPILRLCKHLHNRKHWMFAGSESGGQAIAVIF